MRFWSAGPLTAAMGLLAVSARAAPPNPISFAEARRIASTVGPGVVLAQRQAGVAAAQVQVAGALGNPTVTVTTARETARLGTSLSVPVPLFGQRGRAIAAAESEAESARLSVAATAVEARFAATNAWIDLWEAQGRARLLRQAAEDADRVARVAADKFQAGAGPQVDVLRTRADRARASTDAAVAETSIAAAAARLGIWIAADGPTLRAAGDPGFRATGAELSALSARLGQAPVLRRDAADITAAMARVQAEQRWRWPLVNLLFSVNQGDPTLPATDVIAGVSLEAPVLSLRRGAIARARAEQAVAEATYTGEATRLGNELADATARAQAAEQQSTALRAEVLPALQAARDMTEEGYRDGRVDLLRLLDAQRAVLDSWLTQIAAEAGWQRALADVERAAGVSLEATDAR